MCWASMIHPLSLLARLRTMLACRSWRRAVLEDDQLLLGLTFRLRQGPPAGAHKAGRGWRLGATTATHPVVLQRVSRRCGEA